MQVEVKTWYLEMLSPEQLCPALSDNLDLQIIQAKVPSPDFSRFLYSRVGADWYWLDRLPWSDERWMHYLDRPEVQTWVAYLSGTPAGYIELEAHPDRSVEIAYFGLFRQFMGQGIGKHLLTVGTEQAWKMGGNRVWVHTCTLDGAYALKNYQSRGFQLYKEETHWQEIRARD